MKLHLNVYGEIARIVIYNALVNSSVEASLPFLLENDNEVTVEIDDNADPNKAMGQIIRRLMWYVTSNLKDLKYYNAKKVYQTNYIKEEIERADCIVKMITGTPFEKLRNSYSESVIKELDVKRLDPFTANAIGILKEEQHELVGKINQEIEEFINRKNKERDEKIEEIDKKIEKLRSQN